MINNKVLFKNVSLKLKDNFSLKNLSFSFSSSGISIIIGPNGSGKTLITKLIRGIIIPDKGSIQIKEKNSKISYLSQKPTFLRRNVFNNLAYPMLINGFSELETSIRINHLLNFFDFSDKANLSARILSGGNKQFLSFIRSLVLDTEILILDEPCSNLDLESNNRIENYLKSIRKKKKIIMVTHDLFQAMRLADEILIINNGRLIEVSSRKNILKSKVEFTQNFLTRNIS